VKRGDVTMEQVIGRCGILVEITANLLLQPSQHQLVERVNGPCLNQGLYSSDMTMLSRRENGSVVFSRAVGIGAMLKQQVNQRHMIAPGSEAKRGASTVIGTVPDCVGVRAILEE
jgi:hypothetical protein